MSLFGWLFGDDEEDKKPVSEDEQPVEDKEPEQIGYHLTPTFQSSTENPWTNQDWGFESLKHPNDNWTPRADDPELSKHFLEGLGDLDGDLWARYAPLSYAPPMELHDFSKLKLIGDTYYNPDKTPLTGNPADLPSLSKKRFTADKYEHLSAYRDYDFDRAMRVVFFEEGGYKGNTVKKETDKNGKTYYKIIDPETHYGITPVFLKEAIRLKVPGADKLDLKLITPRQAARLYEEVIWRSKTLKLNQLDQTNPDLMDLLFDTAVNFGLVRAGRMINSAVNGKGKSCKVDVDAFYDKEDKWLLYYDIVQDRMRRHDKNNAFSKGQLERDKRFLARIPKEELKRIVELKKNAAAKKNPAQKNQTAKNNPAQKNQTTKNNPAQKNQTAKQKPAQKNQTAKQKPAQKNPTAKQKSAQKNQQRNKAPTGKRLRKADLNWPLADPMTTERNYPLAEA